MAWASFYQFNALSLGTTSQVAFLGATATWERVREPSHESFEHFSLERA